uniref:Uncharacterized protein n=1 Tax=Oryza glumipatula TaxID=40148 RepID=A0A0D9YPZ0_9ORYZ
MLCCSTASSVTATACPILVCSAKRIGNGCKHRQIRFTEKFFLSDIVVHKRRQFSGMVGPLTSDHMFGARQ